MIYASILAAGTLRNKKSKLPQPYNLLGEKPILIHTLEQFCISPKIDKIIVVANRDWIVYTQELIKKYILFPKEIHIIPGGENKNLSISMAARYIEEKWGVHEEDIFLNHDAIRPFVSQRIIEDNIIAGKTYGVANTVMPTVDTIVMSDSGVTAASIPPKSKMYSEQTPQTFRLKKYLDSYYGIRKEDSEKEEDAVRFMLNQGHTVHLVSGEYSNIKIITDFDTEVANAFLRRVDNDQ